MLYSTKLKKAQTARKSLVDRMNTHWMTALLLLSFQGGHAWVSTFVSKAASASTLRYHTQAALRFRCGSSPSSSGLTNKLPWRRLLLPHAFPFWTTTSSCLYQSTAAADTAAEKSPSSPLLSKERKTEILAHESDFVKPDPDLRQYRWINLPNNLQVLLVSTTETTSPEERESEEDLSHVEAAAVHVQAGHFDDTIPGVSYSVLQFVVVLQYLGALRSPRSIGTL